MSLQKLMNQRSLLILGLNSGTSSDGVDMAALKITRSNSGAKVKFISGSAKSFPSDLRTRLLALVDSKTTTLEDVIGVDSAVGTFFGQSANSFIHRLHKKRIKIDVVASHGQTVRHIPTTTTATRGFRGTLQIGSLEAISKATSRITIGDFRQADVALGNEGAPITVAAMQKLFASKHESRLIVNIGGISNYFYFPLNKRRLRPLAGDCGPGNSLCDILSEKLYNKKFDKDGQWAKRGEASKRILTLLLAEPFFKNGSNSTGRETFGKNFAEKIIHLSEKFNLSKADIISTAAELTVFAIVHKIKPILKRDQSLSKLYLTGGGRKNTFFVKRLEEILNGIKIDSADKLGINADYIEAAAYAVMGEAALRSEPMPTVFNRKKVVKQRLIPVLGKIVQPPVKL